MSDNQIELKWSTLKYDNIHRPTPRNSHNTCSDTKNKHIYLFGGRSQGGCNNHLYVLSKDKLNHGWQLIDNLKGDIPSPRKNSAIAYCASHLYLFGGNSHYKSTKTDKPSLLNDFYAFNVLTNTWYKLKTKGDIPTPRDRHSMIVINNKIFIFGGSDNNNEFLNDLYMYNPKKSVWTKINIINNIKPESRYNHCAASMGNYLIISGGKCESGALYDFWLLDTTKTAIDSLGKWQKVAPKLGDIKIKPKWGHTCLRFHHKLIFFGGWNGKKCFNDVYIIDFGTNPFKVLKVEINGDGPSERAFHGAGIIGNKMIIVCGRDMNKRLSDTYSLDLEDLAPKEYKCRTRRKLRERNEL